MQPAAGAWPSIAPITASLEPYRSRNTCWNDVQNCSNRSLFGLYNSVRSKPADSIAGLDDRRMTAWISFFASNSFSAFDISVHLLPRETYYIYIYVYVNRICS